MSANGRVLMIGLDAADAQFVEEALPSLPHLRRLAGEGRLCRMSSPADVFSASVWPTFYTGSPPGEHGYYFPMQWDPDSMRLRRVGEDWFYREPFWYPLSREGLPVTAFDVQTAFPSRIARGVEITNWGAQSFDSLSSNRPDLVRELVRRFGRHPMGPDVPARKTRRRLAAIRRDVHEGIQRRGEATRWLMQETDWRLFIAVFTELHRAGHNLWPEPDWNGEGFPVGGSLLEVYREVDRAIGRILESVDLGTTTAIVFSLHGMAPNDTQLHFVQPVLDRVNAAFMAQALPDDPTRARQRSVMRRLRELVPSELQELIGRSVSDAVRDWVIARAHGSGFDWSRTPGFALPAAGEGLIRCNLRGRERDGMLDPGGDLHRAYLELVEREFRSLRAADTGAPIVREVVLSAERFPGPESHLLPDLCFRWHGPPASEVHSPSLGRFRRVLDTGRGGNHRGGAFAVVAGRGGDAARERPPSDVADLAGFVTGLL